MFRCDCMSEDEELESRGYTYPYISDILERNRRKREAERKKKEKEEFSKAIEESARIDKQRSELLEEINEKLIDISLSESYWKKIRSFIEGAATEGTEAIVIVLQHVANDRWCLHAEIIPELKKEVEIKLDKSKKK